MVLGDSQAPRRGLPGCVAESVEQLQSEPNAKPLEEEMRDARKTGPVAGASGSTESSGRTVSSCTSSSSIPTTAREGEGEAAGNDAAAAASRSCWEQFRHFCWQRRYRLVGVAVFLVAVIVVAACWRQVMQLWELYTGWLEAHKTAGAFSFVLVTALLTVVCFPAAIPTLAAGAIYGVCFGLGKGLAVGSAVVFVGATAGSLVSFFLGRYACHGCLESVTSRSKWAKALDMALQNNGLKVIVLMRLSPVVPYSVFNYLAALTKVSSRDFILGQVAVIPGTVLFVFLGAQSALAIEMAAHMAGDEGESGNLEDDPVLRISLLAVGVVLAIGAVVLLGYYAKRELRTIVPNLDSMESHRIPSGMVVGQGTPSDREEQPADNPNSLDPELRDEAGIRQQLGAVEPPLDIEMGRHGPRRDR